MKKELLILIGPPGSGKGTQSSFLRERYGFDVIVMGDLLRDAVESKSKDSDEIKRALNSGNLVAQRIVVSLLRNSIEETQGNRVVLDGYPRDTGQFKILLQLTDILSIKLTVLLDIKDERTIFTRLLNRLQCNKCGALFSATAGSHCTRCASTLSYKRDDDNRNIIERRVEQYRQRTVPLLEQYDKELNLHRIEASGSVEEVWNLLDELVKTSYI